jgi:branched-chain amino acid transport system permease protein
MQYLIHVANMVLIYMILGLGLNVLFGFSGLSSLATGALFGIGAYTTGILLKLGIGIIPSIIIAILCSCAFSALSAWPALRIRGHYLFIMTLAMQHIAEGIFENWQGVTGGVAGLVDITRPSIFGLTLITPTDFLPFVFIFAFFALMLAFYIGKSPFGRVLKSMRENDQAAMSIGINVKKYTVTAFILLGFFSGLAGGIYAPYRAFINPSSFTVDQSIFIISIVVLGGTGNFIGTFFGSLILTTLPELLRFLNLGSDITGPIRSLLYGLLLIVFIVFRPEGLFPEYSRTHGLKKNEKTNLSSDNDKELITAHDKVKLSDDLMKVLKKGNSHSILNVSNIAKNFGGIQATNGVTFSLPFGKVTALVGPNGAGKTTIFNLVTGFIHPDSGHIKYKKHELINLQPHKIASLGIVRSWQDVRLFEKMTVLENVLVAIPNQSGSRLMNIIFRPLKCLREEKLNRRKALTYLDYVGLRDRANDLVSSLSYGDQKLLSLARIIATEADILLLDEQVSGVDINWVKDILKIVKQLSIEGKTICIVEHNLQVISALADHALFLDAGKVIAEGTPAELMENETLAKIYFGQSLLRSSK